MTSVLDRLEDLERRATQEPWLPEDFSDVLGWIVADDRVERHNCDYMVAQYLTEDHAALIAEQRNSLKALLAVARAAQTALAKHKYETPAGTTNCRYCDNNMDHEGTYKNMHAKDCVVSALQSALAPLLAEHKP